MAKNIRWERVPANKGGPGTIIFVPDGERIYAAIGPNQRGDATLVVTTATDRVDLDLQLINQGVTVWQVLDVMECIDGDMKNQDDPDPAKIPLVIDNGRTRAIIH